MSRFICKTKGRDLMQCIRPLMLQVLVAGLLAGSAASLAMAQGRLRTTPRPLTLVAPATKPGAVAPDADKEKAETENRFPGGASLKTDRELERLLDRASQFAANKRFDLASVLWQRILDESGDVLRSGDGRLYTALANEVESLLKTMPEEARVIYRIKADGEAQSLLAQSQADNTEALLGKIVRHYFMSSLGDDAAFQLACLALDRQDFVGARRLLERALKEHPDSSLPRGAVLIRHAVAAARSGDLEAAKESLAAAKRAPDLDDADLDDADLLARVEELITAASSSDSMTTELPAGEWPMSWGAANRKAIMASLPREFTSSTLTDYWSRSLQGDAPQSLVQNNPQMPGGRVMRSGMSFAYPARAARIGSRVVYGPGGVMVDQQAQQRNPAENWKRANWMPTTQLAFADGALVLRNHYDIEAWELDEPGSRRWCSAWFNSFDFDAMTQSMMMMGIVDQNEPSGAEGILGFGDRVHGQTTVAGGVVYTIEGRRTSRETGTAGWPQQEQKQVPWGVVPRRARTNFLAAYDVASGKALWSRPASDDATSTQDVGFIGPPTPCGELLLAPITDAGTIYLYALNPTTGATVWKSYLCDEPPGGASPWTPATVSVEGADAYVVCGTGVVFSVDGLSGAIRWAVRYARDSLRAARTQQNFNGVQGRFRTPGWSDDVATPIGKALVIFSSDENQNGESQLFALDRLTGDFLWQSPRISPFNTDASYFLGVWKRGIIVGGRNVVRMYDGVSGRLVWDKELKQSLGRGALTADAIYLPDRDSIVVIDPATGKERSQVGVRLSTGDPVGNLFVDGKQIWVANHDRVYALTNLEMRLEELNKRIVAGDLAARVTRIQLFDRLDRGDEAFPDIEAVFQSQVGEDPAKAHQTLFDVLRELRLVNLYPAQTLNLLVKLQAKSDTATESQGMTKYRSLRDDVANSAVNQLAVSNSSGAVDSILSAKSLYTTPQMVFAAATTLSRVAATKDSSKLIAIFDQADDASKLLVVAALAKHGDAQGLTRLESALSSANAPLRLAVAHELATLGKSQGTAALVELLASTNAEVRIRSHSDLCWITGRFAPLAPIDDQAKISEQQAQWKAWLAEPSLVLKTPLPELRPTLGRILITSAGYGKIYELDQNLKERWVADLPGAQRCLGLPNGHRLATSQQNNNQQVFLHEFDAQGVMLKSIAIRAMTDSLERLPSGSTLLAFPSINQVVEVDEEGKVVWEISIAGQPYDARRLPGGRTLVSLLQGNRVVEIDDKGKIVWEASNLSQPFASRRLPDGNTLIALRGANSIIEVDAKSKIVWTAKEVRMPRLIERLADGRTLVADADGLHILDAEGKKIVSRTDLGGPSGLSAY